MKIDPHQGDPTGIATETFNLRPLRLSDKGLIEMHGG